MSIHLLSDALRNSIVRSCAVLLCAAFIVPACSGGGGGGGTPIPSDDDHPDQIFPGPNDPPLTVLRTGEGLTSGFINTPGDVDYFKMELIGGVMYGLQTSNFPQIYNNSPGPLLYSFLDSTGAESFDTTGDFNWPDGVDPNTGNLRFVWLTPYTGTYYLRVENTFIAAIQQYSVRLTSSQLGVGTPRESSVSNFRSYQVLFDAEGNLRFSGPTSPARLDGEPLFFLEGTIFQPNLVVALDVNFELQVQTSVGGLLSDEVFFFDDAGVLTDAPETPALHIHFGVPSHDLADARDDIFWNYDPSSTIFGLGPNFNANTDRNFGGQPMDSHSVVFLFTDDFDVIPEDSLHLLLGQHWYVDLHFHSQFDLLGFPGGSVPIVSSRPQGGFSMFDSRFILNGFETVPATGSSRTLEVYYTDEHQTFYISYGLSSTLVGSAIHVHSGAPGEVGPELIDLGTVPFPTTRPLYEPEILPLGPISTFRFVPGVENILKRLSDGFMGDDGIYVKGEAELLKDAAFTTGWYIDVHTFPQFLDPDHPEIRTDAILNFNYEVVSSRITSSFLVAGQEEEDVLELTRSLTGPTDQISFIGDDLAYGPIVLYLDGTPIGQLDIALASDDLVCGIDSPGQAIVVTAQPGTYKYHGSAENGIFWEGEVTVEANGGACTTIVLTENDAQVPE